MRKATAADLPRMHSLAKEFYAASDFLTGFDIDRFTRVWTELLEYGMGVIFLEELGTAGEITGLLGGMVHPELYSGDLVAEEFFWFVRETSRGAGIALYRAFEQWAREQGARTIYMVHLVDVMPEKVAAFYRRIGFEPVETRYRKRLVSI